MPIILSAMQSNAEMTADLRELIAMDIDAQVTMTYKGRNIVGTKGNASLSTDYDRDGGGENTSKDTTATFVAADFPTLPDGSEIVFINGEQLRISKAGYDDYNVACVIDFTSVSEI